jgi:hypothetical protein
MKKITREEILEKIKNKDTEYFSEVYYEAADYNGEFDGVKLKKLWEINWGDGNDWNVAFKVVDYDIDIILEGWYSSHGDSEFNKVSLAIAYEFKETRYRAATQAEIRDMKIDNILG